MLRSLSQCYKVAGTLNISRRPSGVVASRPFCRMGSSLHDMVGATPYQRGPRPHNLGDGDGMVYRDAHGYHRERSGRQMMMSGEERPAAAQHASDRYVHTSRSSMAARR